MAVTGSGTQADPFIVHSYDEFMSLSDTLGDTAYIQFFDNEHPNQVIDCNDYGSEFKWHNFQPGWPNYNGKIYINLNGCTIKNFLIADGEAMFSGRYAGSSRTELDVKVSNGFIRNVFLGSATSKFCNDYVDFQDVSISFNFAGTTVTPFAGDGKLTFDNCALYLVGSTLQAPIITRATLTDTDIELHISNLNGNIPFSGNDWTNYSVLQDCRIQGKLGGNVHNSNFASCGTVLGIPTENTNADYQLCQYVNCVVDLDLTDTTFTERGYGSAYKVIAASGSTYMNTNVICNSHYPSSGVEIGLQYPTDWNYMSHENIRNGTYLNNAGFTVVEVVDGD